MAKRRPMLTLVEMERKLGYSIDASNYPNDGEKRFYSDLRPVSTNVYERTKKEFEAYEERMSRKGHETSSDLVLPELGVGQSQTIAHGQDITTITRGTDIGFYTFSVDIHYNFGLDLPLLFTKDEAIKTMTVAKLQPNASCDLGPWFSKLPKELRDKIYIFALPKVEWQIGDVDSPNDLNFAGGLGDPSGFYFPLREDLTLLRVNRKMRQEALPLAYRRTVFHLDDIDDVIKLLIAIGDIGRDNIKSLELAWQSRSDFECQWAEPQVPSEHSLTLPTLHARKCVQLLNQCKNLGSLRLYFESDMVLGMSLDAYTSDPSIRELRSLQRIERVDFWDLGYEPLEQCEFVKWLREAIESPREDGDCGELASSTIISELERES